ncbi:MAG TPA: peptide deformylase [Candidatus Baltobacteraceae bacterium]|jgi:peptide deformylase|nr:peptide deformylase [Candidatus Baltobacteraceae bacterium]
MSDAKSDRQWMSGAAHENIVTVGNPMLRQYATVIGDIGAGKRLADRMALLLRELKGAGLAAPQIGFSERVIVVEVRKTDVFPDRQESPLYAMINPSITEASEEVEEGWEGCFSVPGLMGQVSRHKSITVRYVSLDGFEHREIFNGYVARVIQHECDHLIGAIFLDRMKSMQSITTVANYMCSISESCKMGHNLL